MRFRVWRRRILRSAGLGVAAVLVAVGMTTGWGDPALYPPTPTAEPITVSIVDHGYHAGIVLPTRELAAMAAANGHVALGEIAQQFADYPSVEIGWGEERFYRYVPAVSLGEAARALFRPGNGSVLHVSGLNVEAATYFRGADVVELKLSRTGFNHLIRLLQQTVRTDAMGRTVPAGTGLYGPSAFYFAHGTFHVFNVCNHWVSRLLRAAGAPTSPVLATSSRLMMLDLRLRAGARDARLTSL